jgi:hypothetical protein
MQTRVKEKVKKKRRRKDESGNLMELVLEPRVETPLQAPLEKAKEATHFPLIKEDHPSRTSMKTLQEASLMSLLSKRKSFQRKTSNN